MTLGRILGLCAGLAWLGLASTPALAQNILNLRDADIRVFIEDVSELTGRTFIVDPRVQGRVTVASQTPLSPDEIFEVFVSTLGVSGYTVAPAGGGAYTITENTNAANLASDLLDSGTPSDQFVTEVLRLRYVDAREAQAALRPIISRNGQISAQASQRMLIMVDTAANIERARAILERIDVDASTVELIPLSHTSAAETARIVSNLAQGGRGEGATPAYTLTAVPSSNSILYRGEPDMAPTIKRMIREMDQLGETDSDLTVNYLKYANAEELAPILERLSGSLGPPGASEDSSTVTVDFHKPTNAIIISGDAKTKSALAGVVRQLDIPRAQVLVEAIIVEIMDDASRELGLEFFLSGDGDDALPVAFTNFSRSQSNILATTGAALIQNNNLSD